jgi:hypothetical protein
MNQKDIAELKSVVERVHRCPATYRAWELVRDQERQAEVALFDILGHPRAMVCYAWFAVAAGSDQRRPFTVLREGPVHTSLDAVRLALDDAP